MNKPAAKEPSMDEILSSIRQIIADEDEASRAAKAAAREAEESVEAQAAATPTPAPEPTALDVADEIMGAADEEDEEPLTLSTDQLLSGSEESEHVEMPEVTDDGDNDGVADLESMMAEAEGAPEMDAPVAEEAQLDEELEAPIVVPDDISFADDDGDAASAMDDHMSSPASELPDPGLTKRMAEELLEPAAGEAVRANFSRLNALALGNSGATLEDMVKEMMRPMLKQWLDENLPGMVERVVEKEIQRLSRGE